MVKIDFLLVNYISHETDLEQRTLKALNLVDEAKLLNFAKMANVLIELFGLDDPFRKIGKREGQEVEMKFPALNGSLNFILVSDRSKFESRFGTSKNPTATILINVKREDAIKLVSSIITLRSNLFGILRIVPKLL